MRTLANATQRQLEIFGAFNALYNEEAMHEMKNRFNQDREEGRSKPFYRAYLNIVKKTAKLIKELGIEDTLDKCSFFYYLLWLGIFSKDGNFNYSKEEIIPNPAALGAHVMLGKSVCLQNTDLLSRILRETGTESYIMGCDAPNMIADPTATNAHIAEMFKQLDYLRILEIGNHALSLFKYQDHYFLADPTNMTFLSITDFLEATFIGENNHVLLRPAATLVLEEIDQDYFKNLIIRLLIDSDIEPLSIIRVTDATKSTRDIIARNLNLIEDFRDDITPEIDVVCKTLK